MRVILGDHAKQRFYTRGGTGKLSSTRVEKSLYHTLRMWAAMTNEAVREYEEKGSEEMGSEKKVTQQQAEILDGG
jgi:hypothetical protein